MWYTRYGIVDNPEVLSFSFHFDCGRKSRHFHWRWGDVACFSRLNSRNPSVWTFVLQQPKPDLNTASRYASAAVYAVVVRLPFVRLSVCPSVCHTPVLHQNG